MTCARVTFAERPSLFRDEVVSNRWIEPSDAYLRRDAILNALARAVEGSLSITPW